MRILFSDLRILPNKRYRIGIRSIPPRASGHTGCIVFMQDPQREAQVGVTGLGARRSVRVSETWGWTALPACVPLRPAKSLWKKNEEKMILLPAYFGIPTSRRLVSDEWIKGVWKCRVGGDEEVERTARLDGSSTAVLASAKASGSPF
ncbi:hypothetical protein G7046_g6599 [Stylonectria norvegica]|nr:hypothetical protein G7046_g6599 [Stylonectria norvegica]